MARVVLAMSGGVDSSVSAHLLLEQGHEVIGVFMRHGASSPVSSVGVDVGEQQRLRVLGERPGHKQGCCSAADAEDARSIADRFRIPYYALNLQEDFGNLVDYFVDEYTAGRTPNPCVMCNSWIKFGKLFNYADSVGAEYVATGHHAQRLGDHPNSDASLHRGADVDKDQSYALFGIERVRLSRMLLPVGRFTKPQIRDLATELRLGVAAKKDSQEICFVSSGKHDEFVRAHRENMETSGDIVTTDGKVVGTHSGIERFTVGQRKGLGVALGQPQFVVRIEAETRRVVIGTRDELARSELTARGANWLIDNPAQPFRCDVQIRYNSPAAPAVIEPLNDGRFRVSFNEPCHGVAPGQAAVSYVGDRVLGGGWIE